MRFGLILILPLTNYILANDRIPRRYRINLEEKAENRWNSVIDDHLDAIPDVIAQTKNYVPAFFQPTVFWIAEKMVRLFPVEYANEMRGSFSRNIIKFFLGIANRSGLSLGEIVGLNILYDITAFNRGHIFKHNLGCTSVVAETTTGEIIHGRNLDYDMMALMRNITVIVDFIRNDEIIYTATTFAMYVGVLTGQRPNGFSVTLNARYSGGYIDNILMEIYTLFKMPVSFAVRQALETVEKFSDAVQFLSNVHMVAPSYLVIAGVKSGEGAIITRNRWNAADIFRLNVSKKRWYLVETNYDHWEPTPSGDPRRIVAKQSLDKVGRRAINAEEMMRNVLSVFPVLNDGTIFSTVMSAGKPDLIYDWTVVRDVNATIQ